MFDGKKILAIIPARGGSKGLPRKNLLPLSGKPLIAWSIEQALASEYIDRVIVSTDDKEIANVSVEYGADVPFIRPAELATDSASSADVVIHALNFFEGKGEHYDYIALLEPTSPLRKDGDIDRGIIKLIGSPQADSLVSLGEIHLEHPMIVKKVRDGLLLPYADLPAIYQRQMADEAYFPYGVLYLTKIYSFYESKAFYTKKTIPLFLDRWQNYEVDDSLDMLVIESVMTRYMHCIAKGKER